MHDEQLCSGSALGRAIARRSCQGRTALQTNMTAQPSPAQRPQAKRSAAYPSSGGVQEDVVGNQDAIVGHAEHPPGLVTGRAPAPQGAVQLAVVGPTIICGGRRFVPAALQAAGYSLLQLARAG